MASKKVKVDQPGVLLGMGNPLLDISANVPESMFGKYGLKNANAILAEEQHLPLYKELVDEYKVDYVAGGATQNSIRAAQWMLKGHAGATSFIGSVGSDEFSRTLEKSARDGGVDVHYWVDKETPTGTCAVLVHDNERSLVANLAAANKFDIAHFESADVKKVLDNAQIVYMAGFFLTVSVPSALKVAQHCHDNDKIFMTNLSAEFLCQFFKGQQDEVFPFADYIFGNETEAKAIAKAHNWDTEDIPTIAQKIAELPKKNTKVPRTVVISQGPDPAVVSVGGAKAQLFQAPSIAKSELVDTNGAGDCFVGGFISELIKGGNLEQQIRAGSYCAQIVIRQSGCVLPGSPDMSNYPQLKKVE